MSTWEVVGEDWRAGVAAGTEVGPGGLVLAGSARRGTWRQLLPDVGAFDRLLLSLNPDFWPPLCRVRARARVRVAAGWTEWLSLGVYGGDAEMPRSEATPPSLGVEVATDVLQTGGGPATAAELELALESDDDDASPCLRRAAVALWRAGVCVEARPEGRPAAWGRTLEVPERSQAVEDPAIAGRICSPTSLSMVLAFHGCALPTGDVAQAVYDHGADIYGNWSFNVAFAGERGFAATAARLEGLADLEREVAAGRPVVISHRYALGELSDTPVPSTVGHLIVVRGFTAAGDVVVNDPAADPRQGEAIRRVYRREELARTWGNADRIAYLVRPPRRAR